MHILIISAIATIAASVLSYLAGEAVFGNIALDLLFQVLLFAAYFSAKEELVSSVN